jgi:hypothetical protein
MKGQSPWMSAILCGLDEIFRGSEDRGIKAYDGAIRVFTLGV